MKFALSLILILPGLIAIGCGKKEEGQKSESLSGVEESQTVSEEELLREAKSKLPGEGIAPPPLEDPAVLEGSGPEVLSPFPGGVDADKDGVIDQPLKDHPEYPIDNCPQFYNPEQEDENKDGVGDACQ